VLKDKKLTILFSFFSLICYLLLGYWVEREETTLLFIFFGAAFAFYFLFLLIQEKYNGSLKWIFVSGLIFRVSLLWITPNFSDDNYRFIWDGRILANGDNPYLVFPENYINTEEAKELQLNGDVYEKMNSKRYYTVYPPINQVFFGLSALLAGPSIKMNNFYLRLFILLFEVGLFLMLFRLLLMCKLKPGLVSIYWLNPLVIVELVGNLHFEGVMLFFLASSIYYLKTKNNSASAVLYALSIGVKLIPLMFLPFFIKKMGWRKVIPFYLIIGMATLVMFMPFVSSELIENFYSSIELYFQKFEFNASIYYLVRWIGYELRGYNIIGIAGKVMWLIVFLTIMTISFKGKIETKKKLFEKMLYSLTIYLLFATTVHPWYIIPLVFVAPFCNLKYPIIWSSLVVLSYASYLPGGIVQENPLILFLEYGILILFLFFEMFKPLRLVHKN